MRKLRIGWFVAFCLVIAEIALMAQVSSLIGFFPMLAVLVLFAMTGVWLVKWQGIRTLATLREAGNDPEQATQAITDGVLILVGGLLFIIPGFISDVVGALFLIPFTRKLARTILKAMLPRPTVPSQWVVVEGETVPDERPEGHQPGTVIRGEIEP